MEMELTITVVESNGIGVSDSLDWMVGRPLKGKRERKRDIESRRRDKKKQNEKSEE